MRVGVGPGLLISGGRVRRVSGMVVPFTARGCYSLGMARRSRREGVGDMSDFRRDGRTGVYYLRNDERVTVATECECSAQCLSTWGVYVDTAFGPSLVESFRYLSDAKRYAVKVFDWQGIRSMTCAASDSGLAVALCWCAECAEIRAGVAA